MNLFCKQLGHESGEVDGIYTVNAGEPNTVDAVQVGVCKASDFDLAHCTGGKCNSLIVGGRCDKNSCAAGSVAAFKIKCNGPSTMSVSASCDEKG